MMMLMLLQTDHSSSYLRAARAGNFDKLVDLLDSGKANINTTNAVRPVSTPLNSFISSIWFTVIVTPSVLVPSVFWRCWFGGRKGIWPVKKVSGRMLAWLCVWVKVQICIWPSWCHCHSLSLAPVNPDWFYLRCNIDWLIDCLNGWLIEWTGCDSSGSKGRSHWYHQWTAESRSRCQHCH